MAIGDAHVFPGFLTTVLLQLFFPKPPTTFLTCFCRGGRGKYTRKKSRLNQGSNSQPRGQESDRLTTEPPVQGCYGTSIKYCGKRRKCWSPAFSAIPTMFSKAVFCRFVNPFPNKPWFLRVCSTCLLKTLWEKEKLLVTSNFSFPTVFSTHLENFLPFSSKLELSSANSFSLEESKICRLGKG